MQQFNFSPLIPIALLCVLQACGSNSKTTEPGLSEANRIAAITTLNQAIKPALDATTTTSTDIDWVAGVLPWDRFTLPVFSPNGLHAAVQLGSTPSMRCLSGSDNSKVESTTIELHILDPMRGRRISPLYIGREGLILSRAADNRAVLVESPNGDQGRWIGRIDWATGSLTWLVDDEYINAFPTLNGVGDLAWSRRMNTENRFHLVLKTIRGQRIIDDEESDWILPKFLGNDRLRVFRILDGELHLVELDLRARDPLLTAISLPIVEKGATRALAWQIATTNQTPFWHETHAFYHPILHRMVIWQPSKSVEMIPLVAGSIAAAPAIDNTWLVATENRIVRQKAGDDDGIHIRNNLAIPVTTTSNQWTHLLLIPEGNRLQIRAINLDN